MTSYATACEARKVPAKSGRQNPRARGFWRPLFAGTFLASHAVAYEVIEWLAAEVFGGDLGTAYLGTQGDGFDAPKDMALAVVGSLAALAWLSRPRRGSSPTARS